MIEAERLQKHLPLFRSCAGWTAQDLADKLEVSRQTISTWENYDSATKKGTKLSAGYYLAIRKLLDDAIASDTDDNIAKKKLHMLGTMLEILVDHPEKYTDSDAKAILDEAQFMAPSIMKQPEKRRTLSKSWPMLLATCGITFSVAVLSILDRNKE